MANTQTRFSQSAASLAETVISIATVVSELQHLGEEIRSVNETSVKVLELHQTNQSSLFEIIPQLKQGATNLGKVTKKLDNLEEKIANKADSFNGVEVTLTELVGMVRSYTEGVNLGIESLSDRFVSNLSEQLDTNNQQFHTVVSNLEGYANQLNVKVDTLNLDLMQLLRDNNAKATSEYQKVSDRLLEGIQQTTEYNIKSYHNLGTKIQECIEQLSNIKEELSQIKKTQIDKIT